MDQRISEEKVRARLQMKKKERKKEESKGGNWEDGRKNAYEERQKVRRKWKMELKCKQ